MKPSWLFALWLASSAPAPAFSQGVFVQNVRVEQETRLDWQFATAQNYSGEASAKRMKEYASRNQRYDLFGPPWRPPVELPLILFITPGKVPLEWKQFAPTCQKYGVLFAGVRNAGNNQDFAVRIRAAVDVLDDVRRRYRVDPDRTYVAGFSGGAVVASRLAFSLPECFGGLFCIGQRIVPPSAEALIDRAGQRIRIAVLCGARELVRPEVEHVDQQVCRAYGFGCRCFVSRRAGHRMPKPGVIEAAFHWLEDGVQDRKSLAEKYSATRITTDVGYDAKLWRNSLLKEADARWAAREHAMAVTLLQWIESRWPDTETAKQAAIKSRRFVQQSVFIEDKSNVTEERKAKLDKAYLSGYEKLAKLAPAKMASERRARYAMYAIRRLEAADDKLTGKSARIESLRKIVEEEK